jgi:hypothetical protein
MMESNKKRPKTKRRDWTIFAHGNGNWTAWNLSTLGRVEMRGIRLFTEADAYLIRLIATYPELLS